MTHPISTSKIESYPGFQRGNEALELAQSFFELTPVKYFGFARLFDDNRFGFCFSDNRLAKMQFLDFSEPLALTRFSPDNRKDSYIFCDLQCGTNLGLSNDLYRTVLNEGHIKHHVYLSKRYLGYIDMFALTLDAAEKDPGNFYFSNTEKIKLLFHHLYDRGNRFIKDVFDVTITQSVENFIPPDSSNLRVKAPKTLTLPNGKNLCRLTLAEYEILSLLTQGYSAKMVAQLRKTSPRTVESHLEKIKIKTGLRLKDDLAFWFNSVR